MTEFPRRSDPLLLNSPEAQKRGGEVLFVDLDGTLIPCDDRMTPTRPAWSMLHKSDLNVAEETSRNASEHGVSLCLVSNQPDVERGRVSLDQVEQFFRFVMSHASIPFAAICPHDSHGCTCRKPLAGLFRAASERWGFQIHPWTTMIGDRPSDVQAAEAFGIHGHLINPYPLALVDESDVPPLHSEDSRRSQNYRGVETLQVVRQALGRYPKGPKTI